MTITINKKLFINTVIFSLFLGSMNSIAQVEWNKYEGNPVLEPGSARAWDSHGAGLISVIFDEGIYKGWYVGYDEFENGLIGFASSPDGITWTKDEEYPIFPTGEEGSWDEAGIDFVDILRVDGIYKMWYIAEGNEHYRIGYASSEDGRNWEKYAGNPILNLGPNGTWDDSELLHPSVVYDGESYHMWYNGYGQGQQRTGYAESSDGITWVKYTGNPVLSLGSEGEWDDSQLGLMSVMHHSGMFHMWYSAGHGPREDDWIYRIGYATSTDGIQWAKYTMNPVLDIGEEGAWDHGSVLTSCVLYDAGQDIYKMWYAGKGEKIITGYATSPADFSINVEESSENTPDNYQLGRNFPNPFNSRTGIEYEIPDIAMVELTIYNMLGQHVRTLINEIKSPGTYHVTWEGQDDTGRTVNSGLYLCRMRSGNHVQTRKLLFIK